MQLKNHGDQYGLIALIFHWVLAILILCQIYVGWYMSDIEKGPVRSQLIGLHKEVGIFILFLVAARLLWRLVNTRPSLLELSRFERVGAEIGHWLLYIFMVLVPLSGWLMTSAKGYTVSFLGLFVMPDLVAPNPELGHTLSTVHTWLAYSLLTIIVLHVLAALKHHFINKDMILRRMLP